MLYDNIIRKNTSCVVTYMDFEESIDSISHKYVDVALKYVVGSRKSRVLFRQIYKSPRGTAKINGVYGRVTTSKFFGEYQGVVQGEIMIPCSLYCHKIN